MNEKIIVSGFIDMIEYTQKSMKELGSKLYSNWEVKEIKDDKIIIEHKKQGSFEITVKEIK